MYCNGCNAFNIAGNPIKDINAKLTFLTSASNIVEWTPHPMVYMVYKAFTLDHIISVPDFTEVRCLLLVVMQWIPPFWHLVEILEILLLHVLYNDACKFTINLFPISWEPSQNLIYSIFYCKCRFEMANNFNIAGNPIKDINAKLTFLISVSDIWHLVLTSGENIWNSTFACTLQWCMQICH